jgi:hypothetical protein
LSESYLRFLSLAWGAIALRSCQYHWHRGQLRKASRPLSTNKMTSINIRPSDAISDGICAVCGDWLGGETAFFCIDLESVITRQTKCPPLHRGCAIALAQSQHSVHAIWESGYQFDGLPEPIFDLEKSIRPLEFDGDGDCTPQGINQALGEAWLRIAPSLGEAAHRMGHCAAALRPSRQVNLAALDLSRPRREVKA